MALSKKSVTNLLKDTLVKFYTDIFKPDLENHTHKYAGSSSAGGSATSAEKVNHQLNIVFKAIQGGARTSYDGSSAQTVLINPTNIGAAFEDHTHNYAGSSTAGGTATEAAKTTGTLTIQTNGTNAGTFNGSASKTINITPANIGAATSSHTHNNYAENGVVFTIQNNVETLQRDVNNLKTQVGNIDTILDEINGVSL